MKRRYTTLTEQAKELRREYLREWRKQNPDRVRQYNRTYWERKARADRTEEKVEAEK